MNTDCSPRGVPAIRRVLPGLPRVSRLHALLTHPCRHFSVRHPEPTRYRTVSAIPCCPGLTVSFLMYFSLIIAHTSEGICSCTSLPLSSHPCNQGLARETGGDRDQEHEYCPEEHKHLGPGNPFPYLPIHHQQAPKDSPAWFLTRLSRISHVCYHTPAGVGGDLPGLSMAKVPW